MKLTLRRLLAILTFLAIMAILLSFGSLILNYEVLRWMEERYGEDLSAGVGFVSFFAWAICMAVIVIAAEAAVMAYQKRDRS
jgi:hypothetical protein